MLINVNRQNLEASWTDNFFKPQFKSSNAKRWNCSTHHL